MNSLIIFAATFVTALVGCLQIIHLAERRQVPVAIASVFIGIAQVVLYKLVPEITHLYEGAALVLGGVAGSNLAIRFTKA